MNFPIFRKKEKKAEIKKLVEFPKVKDVMTKRVIYVSKDETVGKALDKINLHGVRGMPVVDKDHKVVGVIHESDILDFINENLNTKDPEALKSQMKEFKNKKVSEIMIKNPVTISPESRIEEAASLMYRHGVDRLPVVKDGGHLVGIISRDDIIKGLTASKVAKKAKEEDVKSVVDDIIRLVNKSPKGISLDDLSSKLNIDKEMLNRWVSILEEHGIVEVDYTITGDKIIKKKKS